MSHHCPAPPDVSQNGGAGSGTLLRAGSTKLDAIRNWGVSTYKCTKQILYEKLGKSSRTVDTGKKSNGNAKTISVVARAKVSSDGTVSL